MRQSLSLVGFIIGTEMIMLAYTNRFRHIFFELIFGSIYLYSTLNLHLFEMNKGLILVLSRQVPTKFGVDISQAMR